MCPDGTIADTAVVTPRQIQLNVISRLYDDDIVNTTVVERLTYYSDGLKVKGYIARPREAGTYPVVLWNRGGFRSRGALDDLTAFLILASTATWGYVVVASQYRGNKGGEGEEDWGGRDVVDALNMLKVAAHYEQADLERVAIEGASRGGMTTYRALTMESRFRCAIVHAGIADLALLCQDDREFCRFIDNKYSHLTDEAKRMEMDALSAVKLAERFFRKTPLLLLHGTADRTVPISQTEALVAVLERVGHPFRFVRIEDGGHVALKDGSYREIDKQRQAWFAQYL